MLFVVKFWNNYLFFKENFILYLLCVNCKANQAITIIDLYKTNLD